MADVFCPCFFKVNQERVNLERIDINNMQKDEIYFMLLQIVDEDDMSMVTENVRIARSLNNRLWIGLHVLIAVKYIGGRNFQLEDGIKISV